jgi:hypothetical protein
LTTSHFQRSCRDDESHQALVRYPAPSGRINTVGLKYQKI